MFILWNNDSYKYIENKQNFESKYFSGWSDKILKRIFKECQRNYIS